MGKDEGQNTKAKHSKSQVGPKKRVGAWEWVRVTSGFACVLVVDVIHRGRTKELNEASSKPSPSEADQNKKDRSLGNKGK